LKAAGWLDALDRDTAALDAALEAVRVVQFGGASGTLAALGNRGPEVADELGRQLGLRVPDLPWHAHRDRLARLACMLGVACGTCGKIGRDLALLAQTEVAEAFETRATGGGSSTMPHKSNPVSASIALASAVRAPGLVATMLAAMPQEHERGLGGWQAEWTTLPELVGLTAGAARAIADALEGLVVNSERMRANVDLTRGAILAESVAMALAPHIGRSDAHNRLEQASKRALRTGTTLAEALTADAEVTRFLTPAELQKRLSPEGYLGAARTFVERVLARSSRIDE
jgi:3-carboxy-cis,cis-muconate cycloisomerase